MGTHLNHAGRALLFGAAYYLLGLVSYRATLVPGEFVAAWWAPSGLALAFLIRADRRQLPWYLGAIALAATAVNLPQPIGLGAFVYRPIADIVEPLASAVILRRMFGSQMRLASLREVAGFGLVGAMVGPVMGAGTVAVGGALLGTPEGTGPVGFGLVWWGSAVLGTMLFAPVLLTWRTPRELAEPRRAAEAAGLTAALAALAMAALALGVDNPMAVVLSVASFPLLAWAAVRFGATGASRAAVALSIFSLSPYLDSDVPPSLWQAIAVQGIYALAALTALTLSALTGEASRQRKKAQAQAARAEDSLALLESALRNAPFAVGFFSPRMQVTRSNAAFDALKAHRMAYLPLLQKVLREGREVKEDVQVEEEGRTRTWLALAFPVRARSMEPLAMGLLMMDVTDRRQTEEERARLLRQAEEAVRVREDFLSIASHELKTPLTPLAVRLSAIGRKLQAGEPVAPDAIDKPLRSLRKLTELINDLLDASRIEQGRLLLHPERQPFNDIVAQAVAPYEGASPLHRVNLRMPDESLWVYADRQRLGQVVTNLVDNAIKYSPAGGDVDVVVRSHPDGVELEVTDHGIGIPASQVDRLFERFYRATNSTVSYGGLGLGLYITRDIVERHGGRIWAQSVAGVGSQFHVVLPSLEAAEVQQSLH